MATTKSPPAMLCEDDYCRNLPYLRLLTAIPDEYVRLMGVSDRKNDVDTYSTFEKLCHELKEYNIRVEKEEMAIETEMEGFSRQQEEAVGHFKQQQEEALQQFKRQQEEALQQFKRQQEGAMQEWKQQEEATAQTFKRPLSQRTAANEAAKKAVEVVMQKREETSLTWKAINDGISPRELTPAIVKVLIKRADCQHSDPRYMLRKELRIATVEHAFEMTRESRQALLDEIDTEGITENKIFQKIQTEHKNNGIFKSGSFQHLRIHRDKIYTDRTQVSLIGIYFLLDGWDPGEKYVFHPSRSKYERPNCWDEQQSGRKQSIPTPRSSHLTSQVAPYLPQSSFQPLMMGHSPAAQHLSNRFAPMAYPMAYPYQAQQGGPWQSQHPPWHTSCVNVGGGRIPSGTEGPALFHQSGAAGAAPATTSTVHANGGTPNGSHQRTNHRGCAHVPPTVFGASFSEHSGSTPSTFHRHEISQHNDDTLQAATGASTTGAKRSALDTADRQTKRHKMDPFEEQESDENVSKANETNAL